MSREIGADPEALKTLALLMHATASELDGMHINIRGSLHAFEWQGPDADAIRGQWNTSAQRAFAVLASRFRDAAAHLEFEVNQQVAASRGSSPSRAHATTMSSHGKEPEPVTVLKYWDTSVDLSGGEGVVGGATADFRIVQLSNGKYEVIETFKGDAGVGVKLGIADASATGVVTGTITYPASDFKDAQRIQRALEIRTAVEGNPNAESLAVVLTKVPDPISTTVVAGVEGSVAVGTPGITLDSSRGTYGTDSANASATVDAVAGVTVTPGHATSETIGYTFSATIGAAATVLSGFGLSASGSGTATLNATLAMNGAHVESISVEGTVEANGSAGLDFGGRHFGTMPPNDSVVLAFQADVDMSRAPADVQQLVADLKSGNTGQAEAAMTHLLAHGVNVSYQVYEGDTSSIRVSAGPVELSGQRSTMHQVDSGQFTA
jgi:hypothetical protein